MEPSDSLTENESSTTLEDFLVMSSSELQYYLQQQGLSVLGTHSSSATRALIAFEQKVEIKSTADQIAKQLKNDYRELSMKHNLNDPLSSSIDINYFPATHVGQIFNYTLKAKAFEAEYIGQFKVNIAYTFFKSGMVGKTYVCSIKKCKIIKTLVTPSQRINDKKHSLWVSFNEASDIVTSFCTCTAGFSSCCKHVVAAVYKVEYANEKGLTNPTCTKQLSPWNSSSKEITPGKVKDMVITEHNQQNQNKMNCVNCKEKYDFDPRPKNQRNVSESDKFLFIDFPKAVISCCYLHPLHEDAPPPLQIIADTAQDGMQDNSKDVIDRFTNCLTFNNRQINELEKCARNQSSSQYWWDQQKGRITASHFHKVYNKMQTILRRRGNPVKTRVIPLIPELVDPVPLEKIPSLERGESNEHDVVTTFMKLEGMKHSHHKLYHVVYRTK